MEYTHLVDARLRQVPLAAVAGLLTLSTATVHFIVAPAHFQEWVGYGVFFLILASLQALYGLGLLVRQPRFVVSPRYLLAGILGSLLIIEVYAVSRILGIPLLGPHAGHVEEIGVLDVLSKVMELGLIATLAAALVRLPGFKPSFGPAAKLATAGFLSAAVALALAGVFTQERHDTPLELPSPGAPTQASRELLSLLTRGGYGPKAISVNMIYAPPLLFQVSGAEPPASASERPTVVFIMAEADHEHDLGLPPQPPKALLRIDGGGLIEPYEVTVLADGEEHRTSRLLFPLPSGLDPGAIDQGEHTFTIVIPQGSNFSWQLPLKLPEGATTGNLPGVATGLQVSGLTRLLTRTRDGVQYQGHSGVRIEATYATPDYFAAAFPPEAASRYLPDRYTIFLLTERLHASDLPGSLPELTLSVEGRDYKPAREEEVTTSPHHRVTLVGFPVPPPGGAGHQVMELRLPGDERLVWHLPISYAGVGSTSGFQLTWVSILAVLGGLVAAMWPCLFQLTAFFIPALGGLSMEEASGGVNLGRRFQVVKAAFFFVLGFTLVYTVGGALIGLAAQRLGDTPDFYIWQRYAAIGGGILIIILALRVASKVRAPLVCKMPVLSKMAHNRRSASPLEMMFAGLAFATGCMTCFGAAMVVAMVVYVGLAGSVAVGALTMFLFSLGMGIPLVLAAIAMAKVLPVLFRLEKVIPWMGLASSLLMVGFAILLITGNYMAFTEWVYRAIPVG
ncbi:MAG: sulfite exporter TauE/SafE family protein [Chloroflexi bacterium]|nr:sulfite exporter TauE/SafE family protein [Chloroflexota bacterium]